MIKKLFLFVFNIFLLSSCVFNQTEKVVTWQNRYSLTIPAFLMENRNLNKQASIKYGNGFKELYVITLEDSYKEFSDALTKNDIADDYDVTLDGYFKLITDDLKRRIENFNATKTVDTVINKMPAKIIGISGRVDGLEVYYKYGFFKGKAKYYQVMTWTLATKRNEYDAQMEKIIYSLKEL